jgi:hypothetical protein
MLLSKGIRKKYFRRIYKIFDRYLLNKLIWAANLKPGDLFASCSGFNDRVKNIKALSRDSKYNHKKKLPYVTDFEIIGEQTGYHSVIHCCGEAETVEQVNEYNINLLTCNLELAKEWWPEKVKYRQERIALGLPLCDEFGIEIKEKSEEPEVVDGVINAN